MSAVDQVRALVSPIVESRDAELYDIEYESGVVRVFIDREGGIDVDTVGELSRLISDALDREDPIPDHKYLLEVSSPGIERKLRTGQHFVAQLNNVVAVKLRNPVDGVRRFQATVVNVDGDVIEFRVQDTNETMNVALSDIESARSVFDWSKTSESSEVSKNEPKPEKKVAAK